MSFIRKIYSLFTIRDFMWAMIVAALIAVWQIDTRRLEDTYRHEISEAKYQVGQYRNYSQRVSRSLAQTTTLGEPLGGYAVDAAAIRILYDTTTLPAEREYRKRLARIAPITDRGVEMFAPLNDVKRHELLLLLRDVIDFRVQQSKTL